MLKVIDFAFTGYAVMDMERARAFYEGVLNLTPATIFPHEGTLWVEYEVGPHVLAITNGARDQWKPSKDGGGVALEVADFDEAIAWLREKK